MPSCPAAASPSPIWLQSCQWPWVTAQTGNKGRGTLTPSVKRQLFCKEATRVSRTQALWRLWLGELGPLQWWDGAVAVSPPCAPRYHCHGAGPLAVPSDGMLCSHRWGNLPWSASWPLGEAEATIAQVGKGQERKVIGLYVSLAGWRWVAASPGASRPCGRGCPDRRAANPAVKRACCHCASRTLTTAAGFWQLTGPTLRN